MSAVITPQELTVEYDRRKPPLNSGAELAAGPAAAGGSLILPQLCGKFAAVLVLVPLGLRRVFEVQWRLCMEIGGRSGCIGKIRLQCGHKAADPRVVPKGFRSVGGGSGKCKAKPKYEH